MKSNPSTTTDIFQYLRPTFPFGHISVKGEEQEKRMIFSVGLVATAFLYSAYKLVITSKSEEEPRSTKGIYTHIIKEIPTPKHSSYPYLGHMFSLGALPSQTISKWHNELGPIIKLSMGVKTWVSVSDHTLAHKISVSHGAKASYRPHSTYAYFHYSSKGKGIGFAQPGPGWREARSAVLSAMAPKKVEKYMDSVHKQSRGLVPRLLNSTDIDGQTDPHKYLELYSLNVILSACFGKQLTSIEDPEFITLTRMIETSIKLAGLENDLSNFLPAFSIFDFFAGTQSRMKRFVKEQRDSFFTKLILDAERSDDPNMVKLLETNGFKFTLEEKIILMYKFILLSLIWKSPLNLSLLNTYRIIVDLVGGGTDTITTTLYWNFALMCNYPEVQKTATIEIDKFIESNNGRTPTFEERKQLPYCISVIKECMRFKPTTSFGLPHAVYDDVEVDGYVIPKGATLITNMESIHLNPELYQKPEIFDPQRFFNNLKTMQSAANGKLEERDHFNFGWGRRICPAAI